MKKIFYISFILLFYLTNLTSQESILKWGPEHEMDGSFTDGFLLLGVQKDYYYFVDDRNKTNMLYKFDKQHNLVDKQPLTFEYNKNKLILNELVETNSGTFGSFHIYDKKLKEWVLFKSPFVNGKFQEIEEIGRLPFKIGGISLSSGGVSLYGFESVNLGGYGSLPAQYFKNNNFFVSEDQSKVGLINPNALVKDGILSLKKKRSYSFAVFDENMDLLWKNVLTYKNKYDFIIEERIVGSDGAIYMLVQQPIKPPKKWYETEWEKKFFIYKVTAKEIKQVEIIPDSEDYFYSKVAFILRENGGKSTITAFGYFDAVYEDFLDGRGGFFNVNIDTELNLLEAKLYSMKAYYEKVDKEETDKWGNLFIGPTDHSIIKVIKWSDDSFSFISQDGLQSINIVNFKADGNFEKAISIPKSGPGLNKWLLYYRTNIASAFQNDKMYLVYIDRFRNDKEEKMWNTNKKELFARYMVINKDLNIEHSEIVFKQKALSLNNFVPYFSKSAYGYLLLMQANGKKNFTFGSIDLK